MKVLLTGGGTGGHVYPAIALAQALHATNDTVLFVGLRSGMEERIVPQAAIPLAVINAAPLRRSWSWATLITLRDNFRGIVQACRIIARFQPDAVIATGGYVTFPVVIAARIISRLRRWPIFIGLLEPNAVPGLTNRCLAPLVDALWAGVAQRSPRFRARAILTGTPVRASLREHVDRNTAAHSLGLDPNRTIILVIGGSQGARSINTAVAQLLAEPLEQPWQILHLCGRSEEAAVQEQQAAAIARGEVCVRGYLDDPTLAYAAADLVVARSGASTLAELAATGKPALLVPYPYATADHQRLNAEAFIQTGAARLVLDADLDGPRLCQELTTMLEPTAYTTLKSAAQHAAHNDATATILAHVRQGHASKGASR